jgi:3-oxoacyl-[acyl-carrier-protein] synthase II
MDAAAPSRRVVITGMGVFCPLGNSPGALWESLVTAQSGVVPLTLTPALEGRIAFGGETSFREHIDDFGPLEGDVKKGIRKALKMMCRESMLAVAAAQQAIAHAAWDRSALSPERIGVVFGSDYMLSPPEDFLQGMLACGVGEGAFDYERWGGIGLRKMNPLWMLSYLPNMPASHIAIFNDLRGPNNSLTLREASSLAAVREAAQTIARGHADVMLAGATGTRLHAFKTIHALQTEQMADPHCVPAEACRPFDAQRSGMVAGEGAGVVVLEELTAAQRRGATIYGEVLGAGSAAVTDRNLTPNRRAALRLAGEAALREAQLAPSAVGHLAAHGLGAPASDVEEARAVAAVFGPRAADLPVVAAKASMGNLGAGSGMVELIASVQALGAGHLYRTLNYRRPDPDCPLAVTRTGQEPSGTSFLAWNVTPQGQATAVAIGQAAA